MSTVSLSFLCFLALFLGVGIYSATRMKKSTEDYLVASRSVKPWLAALSAVATNNSGFMFIGLIGATFVEGLSSMWVMIGWVAGDYVAWRMRIPEKLRIESEKHDVVTIPSFLGHGLTNGRLVTIVAGVVTLAFLGIYSAAQLNAGGKALFTLFGWHETVGAILGACIVVVYCFAGGIRASIWTDAVQSVVMILSMSVLFFACLDAVGGFDGMWLRLDAIDPQLTETFPASPQFGIVLFIVGWIFAGFGVVGQPHVMVRMMAMDSAENMDSARRVYVAFNTLLAIFAIGLGLAARAFLPELDTLALQNVADLHSLCAAGDAQTIAGACAEAQALWLDAASASPPTTDGLRHTYLWYVHGDWTRFDPELAMPIVARALMPEVVVGLCLAGLFAATMSTADSQILSCSASLTQDIFPKAGKSYVLVKVATIFVTGIALSIALYATQAGGDGGGVFNLVVLAWACLAAGLGPMLVLRSFGRTLPGSIGLLIILSGVAGVLCWRYGLGYTSAIYDVLPGMALAFVVYGLWRVLGQKASF
jgi:sodium/proline symporter